MILYHNIRALYTPLGFSAKRGAEMRDVLKVERACILVRDDGTIEYAGPESSKLQSLSPDTIDCRELLALPGFVDSHTHCVFAGERSEEFTMRAEGRSYQEIAGMGGGIRSSVEQVRKASVEEIADYSRPFVERALALGTTTMEIKSGYGLSTEHERKLLRAAHMLGKTTAMEIVPTYLGAHAVPAGMKQSDYVEEIISEQLPALRHEAEFCDVFMDEGYFTRDETIQICKRASELGLKIKLHADELAETNGAATAAELGAFSADHLLKVSDGGIRALASSERTVATLLPITALSLRAHYAPARKLIEAGCAVAIATDCNPGSAMSENMQLAITLGVIGMQMSPAEALTAATLNGAAALGRAQTHGSIERNKIGDFILCDIPRLEYLPYHIGVSDVKSVIKRGVVVKGEL
ncbi:MAG TPA: imidazolonepropionase [Candidatus Kapabacteria bacterium]|jgi:imidazolonepropionase|nr:imidazolonepropionase [Candidatus Kapabacteria bacterium]